MNISIAIDGPSGAGKSTVAEEVARGLGILHLDTGAMYRAFAWEALNRGMDSLDEKALEGLTKEARIEVEFVNAGQRTFINGKDVTEFIRTPQISMAASNVSKFAEVRRFMVHMQQELAKTRSMVLDGRDIGTTVLPNATLKVFLTASPEVRAWRRFAELEAKGESVTYEEVLDDVQRRDLQDTTRAVEPLRPAEGAVIVDTSGLTQQEAVEAVLVLLQDKQEGKATVNPTAETKEKISWSYRAAFGLARILVHTLYPVTYHHVEKAQLDAPYILIANHSSMLDPLIVGWLCQRYQIRFFGKKELTKNSILRALFKSLRMISVDRHNMDMAAVRACMKTLKEGHPLCIFPEGTRHKQGVMQDLESGVAMIALRAKAPLLPAYVSEKPRLFRRVHCYYGDPIPVDALAESGCGKENCETLLSTIRHTFEGMVAEHEAQKRRK